MAKMPTPPPQPVRITNTLEAGVGLGIGFFVASIFIAFALGVVGFVLLALGIAIPNL